MNIIEAVENFNNFRKTHCR